jgi:ferric-dicitrate binding protein FerR (iron transport regulator)
MPSPPLTGLLLGACLSVMAAAPQGPESLQQMLRKSLDDKSTRVATDSAQTQVVELAGGSRVQLRGGSMIRHGAMPKGSIGLTVELSGEMAIEVSAKDLLVQVISRAGMASLSPGSYALRCAAECAALEVTVARGLAILSNDQVNSPKLIVKADERGRAPKQGSPMTVSAADAARFPMPDIALRKEMR